MNDIETIGTFIDYLKARFPGEFGDLPASGDFPEDIRNMEVSVQENGEPGVKYQAETICAYTVVEKLEGKFVIKLYANGHVSCA